jgi:hypothetical protein
VADGRGGVLTLLDLSRLPNPTFLPLLASGR